MLNRARLRAILGAILVLSGTTLFGQPVALLPLLGKTGAQLQWDSYRREGAISDGSNVLAFRVGWPTFVLNSREQKDLGEVTDSAGTLEVTGLAAAYIQNLFRKSTSVAAVPRRHVGTIFIDPGHGGKDPGAIGWHVIDGKKVGIQEKDVVLKVGKMLRGMLESRYPDKKIVMSRDSDVYLNLEKRTEMANAIPLKPDDSIVFVSVHANASLKPDTKGFEVWYLPPEYRRKLLDPSEVSPSSVSVLPILNSMLEEEYTIESVLLGKSILDGLDAQVGSLSPRLGLKENPWAVVRNAKMPSVLVEIGFLTNPDEGPRLDDDAYLRKIATGIYNGIVRYVGNFEQRNTVE